MSYVKNIKSTELKYILICISYFGLFISAFLPWRSNLAPSKLLRLLSNFCLQFYSMNQLLWWFFALWGFFWPMVAYEALCLAMLPKTTCICSPSCACSTVVHCIVCFCYLLMRVFSSKLCFKKVNIPGFTSQIPFGRDVLTLPYYWTDRWNSLSDNI